MNIYTGQVMELLSVDEDTAEDVLDQMGCSGLRFSECTLEEFIEAARDEYENIKAYPSLRTRSA